MKANIVRGTSVLSTKDDTTFPAWHNLASGNIVQPIQAYKALVMKLALIRSQVMSWQCSFHYRKSTHPQCYADRSNRSNICNGQKTINIAPTPLPGKHRLGNIYSSPVPKQGGQEPTNTPQKRQDRDVESQVEGNID